VGRRRLTVLGLCLLLVVGATAAAARSIVGSYRTTISGSAIPALNGSWTVTFKRSGTYVIAKGGAVVLLGRDRVSGNSISLGHERGPMACSGVEASALYRWALSGRKLTMTAIKDRCTGRRLVLTSKALRRT
jgi:hypothetical protein